MKSFVWRQRCFGRHCWVLDPKGEYGALAAAPAPPLCGSARGSGSASTRSMSAGRPPPRAAGNRPARPVAGTPTPGRAARRSSRELSRAPAAPAGACRRGRGSVVAEERTALPTLPLVAEALLRPEEQQARLLGTNVEGLRQDGRQVALELRRLVHGDLAGMFDGETSPGLDLSAGVVVLDLSRLYASPALGLLMVCALSWLQSTLAVGRRPSALWSSTRRGRCSATSQRRVGCKRPSSFPAPTG